MRLNSQMVQYLRCPKTHEALVLSEDGAFLINASATWRYPIDNGIALLLPEHAQALDNSEPA